DRRRIVVVHGRSERRRDRGKLVRTGVERDLAGRRDTRTVVARAALDLIGKRILGVLVVERDADVHISEVGAVEVLVGARFTEFEDVRRRTTRDTGDLDGVNTELRPRRGREVHDLHAAE